MSYVEEHLAPQEKIIYRAHVHWIVLLAALLPSVIATIVIAFGGSIVAGLGFAPAIVAPLALAKWPLLILCGIAVIDGLIVYFATELVITNQKVVGKTGFIRRDTTEVLLRRVEAGTVSQSVLGRLLGYGTVLVVGTGGTSTSVGYIADPIRFRYSLLEQLETIDNRLHSE